MNGQRSFGVSAALSALQTLLARVGIAAISVVTGIVVARWLGPDGKGVYSGIQTLLAVPIALCSGGGAAITYVLTKQRRTVPEIFPALAATFMLLTGALLGGCAVYAMLRGWTFEAVAFALALPPSIVLSWQPSYYIAHGRIRWLNGQQLALAVFTLATTVLGVIVFHRGVSGALAAWICGLYAFAAIIVVDMIRDGASVHVRDFAPRLKELAGVGSQSALNAGLGLLNYRIDSLVLIALLGLPIFGVYSIAVSVGELLFMISRAANTAIGREIGMSDAKRSAEITAFTIRAGIAVCIAAALPIGLFAPVLIHAVYGSRFDGAALPLRILLPGIIAFASAGTFASFFIFQLGRPVFITIINVVMIAAQTAACLVLVPRYGLAGAAAASTATYLLGALVSTILFTRLTGVSAARVWLVSGSDLASLFRALSPKKAHALVAHAPGTHIVLTGAAGSVASLIRKDLVQRYPMVLTDSERIRRLYDGEQFVRADLRDLDAVRKSVRGAQAVIHLGGYSKESPFEDILKVNIRGTYNVLEAARLEGVPRVIIASSGHVTGFYPRAVTIDETAPPRPDSMYAVSKAFAETLGRYYSDKYGMNVFCIRIGHVSEKPEYAIDKHVWLSPADLMQLLEIALTADPGFKVVFGASQNGSLFWNLDRARSLGYAPNDGASTEDCPPSEMLLLIERLAQGESFASAGFTGSLEQLYGKKAAEGGARGSRNGAVHHTVQGTPEPTEAAEATATTEIKPD